MEKKYKLTPQGSLSVLALGHIGLRLWRQEVEKSKKEKNTTSDSKHVQKQKK